ncbi:MAG: DUF6483 family protein [Clostridiales bacterium]|nr:DUF6483 family protein [Clostridiales bacterium]
MFEQDYIMRQIKEMVRAILKLLFNIDTESPTEELLQKQEEKEQFHLLLDLVEKGRIDEAENRLYDIADGDDLCGLEMALLFYSHLNDKSDPFLEEHGFSREEVQMGLKDIVARYGLAGIADTFLSEL